jgi:hypothetical protein
MALITAAVLGATAGGVSYQVAKGVPKPRPIDGLTRQTQRKNPYWRNWVGEGEEDVREDSYMYDDTQELRNEYPRLRPDGTMSAPDNNNGVNPAVGAVKHHPGWPMQQFRNQPNQANRAPMPPKQKSLPTK